MPTLTQLPEEYNLEFWAGDVVRFSTYLQDPDPDSPDPENPVMVIRDLTDHTVRAQVRKTAKESEVLAVIDTEILANKIYITLEKTPSESLRALGGRKGHWDLELTDPNGDPETILAGWVLAKLDVTRD